MQALFVEVFCFSGVYDTILIEHCERVRFMCNLSDGIEAKGVAKGKAEAYASMVIDGLLEKEVAAERSGLSMEEFERFLNAAKA